MNRSPLYFLAFVCACLLPACLAGADAAPAPAIAPTMLRPSPCAAQFEQRAGAILARRGLPHASTFFPPGEAAHQDLQFPGELCPDRALALAVDTMLHDDAPESFTSVHRAVGQDTCSAHCFLNRASTLWGIVADEGSMLSHQVLPEPPGEASLASHWIFFVSVADLSEHGYWALVARDGSGVRWLSEN